MNKVQRHYSTNHHRRHRCRRRHRHRHHQNTAANTIKDDLTKTEVTSK